MGTRNPRPGLVGGEEAGVSGGGGPAVGGAVPADRKESTSGMRLRKDTNKSQMRSVVAASRIVRSRRVG